MPQQVCTCFKTNLRAALSKGAPVAHPFFRVKGSRDRGKTGVSKPCVHELHLHM